MEITKNLKGENKKSPQWREITIHLCFRGNKDC